MSVSSLPLRALPCPSPFPRRPAARRLGGGTATGSRWRGCRVWSSAEEEGTTTQLRTLPIFPLNVVAMPGCMTPLYIFEARYRVLFNTLLSGAPDLEEDLIQADSPFAGSREFGMCFSVGETMSKLVVVNKGLERFEVKEVLRMKPVVVCQVEMLPDIPDAISTKEMEALSEEVSELYRNVARGSDLTTYTDPIELDAFTPYELSFWFATLFSESQAEQQKILEERSCKERLLREKKIFDDAVKYLSAASAVKGAFQSDLE